MRKYSQFIYALMLSTSFATMARADDTSSLANCEAAGEGNCVQIGTSGTYYALSGNEGNQTMTIYGTNADGTAATVPEKAFIDQSYKSTFPEDVTSLKTSGNVKIGHDAFSGATGLRSVDLTGVQTIGFNAFKGATGLTGHLDLTGVETIEHDAFQGATGLTSVDLTGVQTIRDSAFMGATGLTSVDLTGVRTIGSNAFAFATGLTSVDLTGVQTIGSMAFWGATKLKSVVISDSLLDAEGNILQYAYRDGGYTGIDNGAFLGSGLNTIYCPKGKTCGNSFYGLSGTRKIISYSIENGQIKAGGKTYASFDDLASGKHIPKRIYTIDEANAVAGEKNRVSIRYR